MNIKIYQDRYTETCNIAGTQFEQNATTIKLDFSKLDFIDDECVKSIHFFHDDLSEENYIGDSIIENDEFKIPKTVTEYENVLAFIQITKEDFIWKTQSFKLDFYKSLDVDKTIDDDELGILQELILEVKEIQNVTTDKFEEVAAKATEDFNKNATEKTNSFNSNAETKTTEFNNNATSKTESFNSNATSKETSYNENATSKLNEYNENHTIKMNAYNENSAEKLAEFNENAAEKLEEYDEHIEELDNIVSKNTANGESIYIDDALEYKVFDAKIDGNASQETTTGKNYFNAYAINNTAISVENDGQTIAIDVVASGNGAINTHKTLAELCPNLSTGDQVTLRFNRNLGNTYNNFIYLGVPVAETWKNGTSKTITEEMLNCEVQLYGNRYMDGETEQCIITDFTIMKSSETDTTFEPFTNNEPSPNPDYPQDIEVINGNVKIINCGKNLITKQGLSTPLNENDYYDSRTSFLTPGVDGWGHLECNNSSGSSSKYINIFVKKKNIYVKENSKYTLFVELKNVSNLSYLTVNQVVNDDLFQELRGINNGELVSDGIYKFYVTTKEVLSDDMVLRIYTGVPAGNVISFDMRLMVLESDWTNKEVEYEAFQSNEYTINLNSDELVKLADDTKDTIEIGKSGNVSLSKRIGKVVLNGTENWIFNESGTNYIRFTLFAESLINNQENNKKYVISDYFISSTIDETVTDSADANRICAVSGQRLLVKLVNDNVMNLDDFKAWLAEHNVTVYYELAEPTTTSLAQLTNFKTFEGINHFFLEANISTNFEVTYAQDLQKVISKQQEEINELKTLLSSKATSAMLLDNYANDLMEEV